MRSTSWKTRWKGERKKNCWTKTSRTGGIQPSKYNSDKKKGEKHTQRRKENKDKSKSRKCFLVDCIFRQFAYAAAPQGIEIPIDLYQQISDGTLGWASLKDSLPWRHPRLSIRLAVPFWLNVVNQGSTGENGWVYRNVSTWVERPSSLDISARPLSLPRVDWSLPCIITAPPMNFSNLENLDLGTSQSPPPWVPRVAPNYKRSPENS